MALDTNANGNWLTALVCAIPIVLFALTVKNTHVDYKEHCVLLEWRLFGRVPVWERRRPFREFFAVEVRRESNSDSDDDVYIDLLSRTGERLQMHHFKARDTTACHNSLLIGKELAGAMEVEYHNCDPVS